MNYSRFRSLFVTALIALLAACAAPAPDDGTTTLPPTAPVPSSQAGAAAVLSLQQTVWAWHHTQQSGVWLAPANPARYTLTFRGEGRLAVTADCNRGGTAYHLQDDRLTFEAVATTKMLCAANSLDRDFLDGLRAAERYRLDDKTLTLLFSQGGEMVFTPVQP